MPSLSLFGVPYGVTPGSPRSVVGEPEHRLAVTPLRDDLHTRTAEFYVPK